MKSVVKTLTVEPYLYEPEELVQVHDDAGMVMMICIQSDGSSDEGRIGNVDW